MSLSRFGTISRMLLAGCMIVVCALPLAAQQTATQQAHPQQPAEHPIDMTPVKPESVGFSSERLERLHALMQQAVDKKQIAGMVTILARHGKVVDYRTYGQRDMAAGTPMTKDTIFRDYSMTKPITGVAMMILLRRGQMAAPRSDLEIHPGVRAPEGLQRRGCGRQDDSRRPGPRSDHARVDDAHRRLYVRNLRQYSGRCNVPRPACAGCDATFRR